MDHSSQDTQDLAGDEDIQEVHGLDELQAVTYTHSQQPISAHQRGAAPLMNPSRAGPPISYTTNAFSAGNNSNSNYLHIDSEEEEEASTDSYMDMSSIRALKDGLLDPSQKEARNRELLDQMLALDEPSLTPKMFDFLVQDGVAEALVAFVAQPAVDAGSPRPVRVGVATEALKKSYKVTMLLTSDEPTEALLSFLNQTVRRLTVHLFKAFRDDSTASFYHVCRVLEFLLRYHPSEVYDTLNNAEGGAEQVIGDMVRHIGYSPVGDTLVKLVALTNITRMSHLYATCAKYKWKFYESMAEWRLLVQLARAIADPETACFIHTAEPSDSQDDVITADFHAAAATIAFQDLIEKLATDESGEILLQPIGHAPELIDDLVNCAVNAELPNERRRYAMQTLSFLLKRTADEQVVIFSGGLGMAMAPKFLPNRLYPLRAPYLDRLSKKFNELCRALLQSNGGRQAQDSEAIIHPGGYSAIPFSSSRLALVELVVLLVESNARLAILIPVELWRELLQWCFRYPHNNIYHSLYYRLLFQVLRDNHKGTLQAVVQKCKLVNKLVEAYHNVENTTTPTMDTLNQGFILRCCNAIRLQAQSLAPASFLRSYLKAHDIWREFLPQLRDLTIQQTRPGMGIPVPTPNPGLGIGMGLMLPSMDESLTSSGIDHGSQFARSLGFEDDVDWPEDEDHSRKKRKTKKKRKSKGKNKNRGSFRGTDSSLDGDEDDGDGQDDDDDDEDDDGTDVDDGSVERASNISDVKEEEEGTQTHQQREASLNELD